MNFVNTESDAAVIVPELIAVEISTLGDLQLALIGGGIGDVVPA